MSIQFQVSKAKAQVELNLSRDIKDSKKSYYKYVSDKRKTREKEVPLKKETVVTQGMEKAEVLKFLPQTSPVRALATVPKSQVPKAKIGRMKNHAL